MIQFLKLKNKFCCYLLKLLNNAYQINKIIMLILFNLCYDKQLERSNIYIMKRG